MAFLEILVILATLCTATFGDLCYYRMYTYSYLRSSMYCDNCCDDSYFSYKYGTSDVCCDQEMSVGGIIGIVISLVIIAGIVIFLVICIKHMNQRRATGVVHIQSNQTAAVAVVTTNAPQPQPAYGYQGQVAPPQPSGYVDPAYPPPAASYGPPSGSYPPPPQPYQTPGYGPPQPTPYGQKY